MSARPDAAEVVVERDLAEGLALVVFGAALDHQLAQLVARLQAVDQLAVERELAGVAAGRGEALRRSLIRASSAGRQLACLLDAVGVGVQSAVVRTPVGLERRFRRLVGDEGLAELL